MSRPEGVSYDPSCTQPVIYLIPCCTWPFNTCSFLSFLHLSAWLFFLSVNPFYLYLNLFWFSVFSEANCEFGWRGRQSSLHWILKNVMRSGKRTAVFNILTSQRTKMWSFCLPTMNHYILTKCSTVETAFQGPTNQNTSVHFSLCLKGGSDAKTDCWSCVTSFCGSL